MSGRWTYKVLEIKPRLFAGSLTDRLQAELDRMGATGWELVSVVQTATLDSVRLFFRRSN